MVVFGKVWGENFVFGCYYYLLFVWFFFSSPSSFVVSCLGNISLVGNFLRVFLIWSRRGHRFEQCEDFRVKISWRYFEVVLKKKKSSKDIFFVKIWIALCYIMKMTHFRWFRNFAHRFFEARSKAIYFLSEKEKSMKTKFNSTQLSIIAP